MSALDALAAAVRRCQQVSEPLQSHCPVAGPGKVALDEGSKILIHLIIPLRSR